MKIGAINNRSFGAVFIEQEGNSIEVTKKNYKKKLKNFDISPVQKKTIKNIFKNPGFTEKLVKDLENLSTDIYISPKRYSDTVGIKLYTDIDWFGEKIIPYDGRYTSKMETFINPTFQGEFISNLATTNFFQRAKDMDFGSDKNLKIINEVIDGLQKVEKKEI